MSELHKFIFDGLPVRGALVRLTDSWQELLRRREGRPFPEPLRVLLGEMSAAGLLMQSTIRFNGALVLVTHHVEEIVPAFTHALPLRAGAVVAAGPLARVLTATRLTATFGARLKLRRARGRYRLDVAPA